MREDVRGRGKKRLASSWISHDDYFHGRNFDLRREDRPAAVTRFGRDL